AGEPYAGRSVPVRNGLARRCGRPRLRRHRLGGTGPVSRTTSTPQRGSVVAHHAVHGVVEPIRESETDRTPFVGGDGGGLPTPAGSGKPPDSPHYVSSTCLNDRRGTGPDRTCRRAHPAVCPFRPSR